MSRSGGGAGWPVPVVRVAAGVLVVVALGGTLLRGLDERGTAFAFGALVAAGELTRHSGEDREPAPLAAAGAIAYALLAQNAGHPTQQGVLQTVAVVTAGTLLGSVPRVAAGRGPTPDQCVRRLFGVALAAVCMRPVHGGGRLASLADGPAYPLLITAVLAVTALGDVVLAAALARARARTPGFVPLLREEARGLLGIGSAVGATGVVLALAVAVAGLWALPVFSLPLLLTQLSLRRYTAVRATYRQTIASLARATEVAGCTPHGHARRVAELSGAVGRDLGLCGERLKVLEYAALMHDIGQLSLVDPVPEGATAGLPPAEQRRIALLGGAVVRQTGVEAEVARVVEQQADPYREQPLAARIVRVANAYDELVRTEGPAGALTALEKLRLATGREYQPQVVEALGRVLGAGAAALPGPRIAPGHRGLTGPPAG
ncbi:HD-GYP domain-containing protein [Streptomyces sp. NPDC058045]|uniref:HD-GYP domain-containing protein n=1 Tax=Streptomyces sp. NPDC058045 TaxID=3346311 RepID=UPI0036E2D4D9